MTVRDVAVMAAACGLVSGAAAQITILSDNFDGVGGDLNGSMADVGGAWSASAGWFDDGLVDARQDGGALLGFNPVADTQYTLTAEFTNDTAQWIAIGFGRDDLQAPGGEVQFNDRFSNEIEGISWALVRNDPARNDIEVFAGLRTGGNLFGGDVAGLDFASPITLEIVIDTTGDGSSFMAEYFVNGTSLLGGAAMININIDDINYAGFSLDAGDGTDVSIQSFSLTQVPAPGAAVLAGLGGVIAGRRRR